MQFFKISPRNRVTSPHSVKRSVIFLPTVLLGKPWHRGSKLSVSDGRASEGRPSVQAPDHVLPDRACVGFWARRFSLEPTAIGLGWPGPSPLRHHPAGCVTSGQFLRTTVTCLYDKVGAGLNLFLLP